ncbi:MAG: hypothetical protein J6A79_01250, partial [Clostridia bacterium]|nr:hypothetical protein [Clostridia bacterium]
MYRSVIIRFLDSELRDGFRSFRLAKMSILASTENEKPSKTYLFASDGSFSSVDKNGKLIQEQPGEYHIIHIHVPVSPSVVRHKGRIFDRNDDADMDITDLSDRVFRCYARKQSTYYVNKVYPHWNVSDLRADL